MHRTWVRLIVVGLGLACLLVGPMVLIRMNRGLDPRGEKALQKARDAQKQGDLEVAEKLYEQSIRHAESAEIKADRLVELADALESAISDLRPDPEAGSKGAGVVDLAEVEGGSDEELFALARQRTSAMVAQQEVIRKRQEALRASAGDGRNAEELLNWHRGVAEWFVPTDDARRGLLDLVGRVLSSDPENEMAQRSQVWSLAKSSKSVWQTRLTDEMIAALPVTAPERFDLSILDAYADAELFPAGDPVSTCYRDALLFMKNYRSNVAVAPADLDRWHEDIREAVAVSKTAETTVRLLSLVPAVDQRFVIVSAGARVSTHGIEAVRKILRDGQLPKLMAVEQAFLGGLYAWYADDIQSAKLQFGLVARVPTGNVDGGAIRRWGMQSRALWYLGAIALVEGDEAFVAGAIGALSDKRQPYPWVEGLSVASQTFVDPMERVMRLTTLQKELPGTLELIEMELASLAEAKVDVLEAKRLFAVLQRPNLVRPVVRVRCAVKLAETLEKANRTDEATVVLSLVEGAMDYPPLKVVRMRIFGDDAQGGATSLNIAGLLKEDVSGLRCLAARRAGDAAGLKSALSVAIPNSESIYHWAWLLDRGLASRAEFSAWLSEKVSGGESVVAEEILRRLKIDPTPDPEIARLAECLAASEPKVALAGHFYRFRGDAISAAELLRGADEAADWDSFLLRYQVAVAIGNAEESERLAALVPIESGFTIAKLRLTSLCATGEWDGAVALHESLEPFVRMDVEVARWLGEAYYRIGDYKNAADVLLQVRGAGELSPAGLDLLMRCLQTEKKWEQLAEVLEGEVQRRPRRQVLMAWLAQLDLYLPERAKAVRERIADRLPDWNTNLIALARLEAQAKPEMGLNRLLDSIKARPQAIAFRLALAQFYHAQFDVKARNEAIKELFAFQGEWNDANWIKVARGLAGMGLTGDALASYNQAAVISGGDPRIYSEAGDWLFRIRDYRSARNAYEKAWKRSPKIETGLRLVEAAIEQNDAEGAERALADMAEHEKDPRYQILFARVAQMFGQDEAAEAAFGRAIQVSAASAQTRYLRATYLHGVNKNADGYKADLEDALRMDPAHLDARVALAYFYGQNGEVQRGRALLEEAPPLNREAVAWRLAAARLAFLDGDYEIARISLEAQIKDGITNRDALALLCSCYEATADFDQVIRLHQQILQRTPEHRVARLNLALTLALTDYGAVAAQQLGSAALAGLGSSNAASQHQCLRALAVAHDRAGANEKALFAHEQLRKIGGEDGVAMMFYGDLLIRNQQGEKGIGILRKAAAILSEQTQMGVSQTSAIAHLGLRLETTESAKVLLDFFGGMVARSVESQHTPELQALTSAAVIWVEVLADGVNAGAKARLQKAARESSWPPIHARLAEVLRERGHVLQSREIAEAAAKSPDAPIAGYWYHELKRLSAKKTP